MKGNAPNSSATGSQIDRVRNPKPNFWNGSTEPRAISTTIRTASPAIETANRPVVNLNNGSPMRGRALRFERARPVGHRGLFSLRDSGDSGPVPASVEFIVCNEQSGSNLILSAKVFPET